MLFHTPEFMVLMITTMILYYLLPNRRIFLLSIANVIFYAVAGIGHLFVFIAVSIFTYYCSKMLRGKHGKAFLAAAVLVNVFNLVFFKYTIFLLRSMEQLLSIQLLTENSFWLTIVLPIGISFYTFQMIAYVVDIYKGKINPSRTLLEFWVFIAYFASLIAGPIMRGQELLPQVENIRSIRFDHRNMRIGAAFLGLGLFKKIVLADYISGYVDTFFSRTAELTGAEGWVAIYLFAFQIFFDFAAYSEMAVGIGYLFGIKLVNNFQTPYLSTNATEFWRRWHITLSSFIRDYIYIPLGGSRKGKIRQYVNLFLAMTISGIWHGAAWTFMIWGMFHGALLIGHKLYNKGKERLGLTKLDSSKIYHVFAVIVFFHLTCIGWVFFRVSGFQNAVSLLQRMLTPEAFLFPKELHKYLLVVVVLYLLHIVEYYLFTHASKLSRVWHVRFPAPVRAVVYTVIITVFILLLRTEQNTFIYFQF
ncbi:MBOAT family protein [Paenibacillus sp. J2TS4]|uniref:MBOAT family O-acyltransferase n=1 Tax=Paenibacillus sp. J2TS4 TaxID=2807194 RepID=UPI001B14E7B2|nr:MBOAT family O-acyltransferase [Paenibacillus sp. J2TS4]GIP33223.1 alginate O-acetyltransferase [Paenibacillus sp. J2TS4]